MTVLIFFALIGVVFWLASLSGKEDWEPSPKRVAAPAGAPPEPFPVQARGTDRT